MTMKSALFQYLLQLMIILWALAQTNLEDTLCDDETEDEIIKLYYQFFKASSAVLLNL